MPSLFTHTSLQVGNKQLEICCKINYFNSKGHTSLKKTNINFQINCDVLCTIGKGGNACNCDFSAFVG